jgi:hypothetical protein
MKFRFPFRCSKTPALEMRPQATYDVRRRIIIHAGFGKCGSSSIQAALVQNFFKLQRDGFSLFGRDLRIARNPTDLGPPVWALENTKEKGETLTHRIADEAASAVGPNGNRAAILSAENLEAPQMAPLFAGLDSQLEVSLVFYLRPQLEWIPSAWKQWAVKRGMSLSDFVSDCIRTRRPTFKLSIDTWKSVLPTAQIHVRFLIPEMLTGGNPAQDFFHLAGLPIDNYDIGKEHRNRSLDFSILHVLSKNPHLSSSVHDNELMTGLMRILPEKFQSTNIQMLSREEETLIEEFFRDENLCLLKTYCSGIDVDRIYRNYFSPREAETRYSDVTDIDLVYRCLGIILESIAFTGGQAAGDDNRTSRPTPSESQKRS